MGVHFCYMDALFPPLLTFPELANIINNNKLSKKNKLSSIKEPFCNTTMTTAYHSTNNRGGMPSMAHGAVIALTTTLFIITVQHVLLVGKTLAGYKLGRPLSVLPRNRSRLPQGLPLNGVPRGGDPSLQVEGCQSSNN